GATCAGGTSHWPDPAEVHEEVVMDRGHISRRGFLHTSAGVLVGALGLPLIEACTPTTPSAPAGGAAGGAAKPSGAGLFPTYIPATTAGKPDSHSTDPPIVYAYAHFP